MPRRVQQVEVGFGMGIRVDADGDAQTRGAAGLLTSSRSRREGGPLNLPAPRRFGLQLPGWPPYPVGAFLLGDKLPPGGWPIMSTWVADGLSRRSVTYWRAWPQAGVQRCQPRFEAGEEYVRVIQRAVRLDLLVACRMRMRWPSSLWALELDLLPLNVGQLAHSPRPG